MKYTVFEKNNTEVFLFAQFLRCVPNFAAIGPIAAKFGTHLRGPDLKGASKAPPPPPVLSKYKIAQYS